MRVALVVWCACVICDLATSTRAQQTRAPAVPPPTITVIPTLIGQKYCRGHEDNEYPLHVRLRFTFRNDGKKAAIVYGSPTVARVMIAADMNGFRTGHLEFDMSVSTFSTRSEIDERFFVAIKPGKQHEYDGIAVVPVIVNNSNQLIPGLVSAGAHLMRVTVDVFPFYDERAARQWVHRFSKRGVLELGPLVSEPVSLQISDKPKLQRCD